MQVRWTYCRSPHQSCHHNHCRNHTASGQGRSGCSCSGTDKVHMFAHLGLNKNIISIYGVSLTDRNNVSIVAKGSYECVGDSKTYHTAFFFGFIWAISTVIFTVTFPACGDAPSRVLTPELIHSASHLSCRAKHQKVTQQRLPHTGDTETSSVF